VQPPTINATATALRFFFKVTLDQPETTRHLVFVYEPRSSIQLSYGCLLLTQCLRGFRVWVKPGCKMLSGVT
jgi:hypothetical protein